MWRKLSVCFVIALLAITACSNAPKSLTDDSTVVVDSRWKGTLISYATPTPSLTPIPPTAIITPDFTATPTPTPFIHAIQEGETMLGVAIQYGLNVDELQSANPDADPRLLSIGQELVIPILEDNLEQATSMLEPIDLHLSSPRCYPSGTGGMNCIVEIVNQEDFTVENIQVWFGLFDDGDLIEGKTSISDLTLLEAGKRTALTTAFEPHVTEKSIIAVEQVSAMKANQIQKRFAPYQINRQQVKVASNKKQAQLTGTVLVVEPVRSVWISALAYDEDGQIIGVRKWKGQPVCPITDIEAGEDGDTPTSTPQPCDPVEFDLIVYSLGPNIADVEMMVEAAK